MSVALSDLALVHYCIVTVLMVECLILVMVNTYVILMIPKLASCKPPYGTIKTGK